MRDVMTLEGFLSRLLIDFKYAYISILDTSTGGTMCEGISESLFRVVDLNTLHIRAFKVYDVDDGSTLIDIYI